MSDEASAGGGSGRGVSPWLIFVIVAALIGAVIGAVVLLSTDNSGNEPSAETTVAPADATTPAETDPAATEPVETEPAATDPPATEPPPTEPEPTDPPPTEPPADFGFSIDGIEDGEEIPTRFTCDGTNEVPIVTVERVPEGTQQLAFLVDDPDAPSDDPFVHWVVYGIPPTAPTITDGVAEFTYGLNDVQLLDWFGPCPPPGDGPHEYFFTLFALSEALQLEPGLDGRQMLAAIEPVIQSETELRASYER